MTEQGHKVASLHGAKDAAERDSIIDNFREGRDKVLITTNVIARGIDILQVNMVVNYDLPLMNDRGKGFSEDARPDIETYLHRIGEFQQGSSLFERCLIWVRAYWTIWSQGYFDQLCARQEDMAADGANRKGAWEENNTCRDW